ncbi:AraC family transcriptional regulator [Siphonobacter aquaeclarae]|uniref:Transcriptional regulator, AraC family n=1 Tax=Siphonobacter aquaeclarae TaxID=563176 RepID=A0A1G9KB14_9BACT|nr:AraC family transcriptional regulator [Siphonobacter aquaeclarae]SDL46921.1 transcriptional regulator, AraC family [Siphonobacter aquaeclarae]
MTAHDAYTAEYLEAIDQIPDSVYVLHEKQEHRFPFHQHGKGQLSYIEGGIAYLNTRNKAYFVPARHYVWIPPGLEHFVHHATSALMVRNIYFLNEDDGQHPFFRHMGIYPVSNLLQEMLKFSERWKGNIIPGGYPYEFLVTMKHLLPDVSTHPLPIALPTTDNERLRPVILYIRSHLGAPLSLPEVAFRFGFSERTLSRLFQQVLNLSFLQYVKMCRIITAIEQLLQTDKSVTEIAYDVGYSSLPTFSNTFYQLVNRRPAEFRNSLSGSSLDDSDQKKQVDF